MVFSLSPFVLKHFGSGLRDQSCLGIIPTAWEGIVVFL
jgi:hypothetical protein